MWGFFQTGSKSGEFFHKCPVLVVNTEVCIAVSNDGENLKKMSAVIFSELVPVAATAMC